MDMITMFQQAFLYLLPLFLTFLLFFNILTKTNETKRKNKFPPGPLCLPILGNIHLLNFNKPHHSLLNLSNKYGPLMHLQLGSIPTVVVSSRNMAENIFTNHEATFFNRPILVAITKLLYNNSGFSFTPNIEQWRQARKISITKLFSPVRVLSFEKVRGEEVKKLVAIIKDFPSVNLSELILSFANNVVCRATLGDEFGDGEYGVKGGVWLHQLTSDIRSLVGGFCVADYFPCMKWVDRLTGFHERLEKTFMEMDKFFDSVIEEHVRKGGKGEERICGEKDDDEKEKDLLQVLLTLHQVESLHGGFLSNIDHVKAMLVEAFVAGIDTMSSVITWTMTELMRNPRVMNKLQRELQQATNGSTHRLIQESELEKLVYLKQVIKESLRLKPPAPLLLRETIRPCEIEGYIIPANTRVIFNAMAISTDPNVWEKPLEFWPERFDGSKTDFKGQDFELLPFGSGKRKCPGISFAMVIVELVLANLLYCFDWSMPDGMKAEDINMEEAIGMTTPKKEPLCLVAKSMW